MEGRQVVEILFWITLSKRILFITTLNLATNPRLVKEINMALQNNFKAEIICFKFSNWSADLDEELREDFQKQGVTIHSISAGKKPFFPWLISVIKEKKARACSRIIPLKPKTLADAVSRRNSLLLKHLTEVETPDLVIGHNPGALYPAYVAGRKFNCRTGFDIEDYHPGEGNDSQMQNLTRQLIQKVLPGMDYASFASPLIMAKVVNDGLSKPARLLPVLNYFPASEFEPPCDPVTGPVKMVWFSQNISRGRGLELILPLIKKLNGILELHLFGNPDNAFYEDELKNIGNIFVHPPLSQKDLHKRLSSFDVGLALEPAKDLNNKIAVSNKILAYLQSGLFVLATNTPAQETLLASLPGHGVCFDYQINNIEIFINEIISVIENIRSKRKWRYQNFCTKNWENESLPLLQEWNNLV